MFIQKIYEFLKPNNNKEEKNKFTKPEGYKNVNTSSTCK